MTSIATTTSLASATVAGSSPVASTADGALALDAAALAGESAVVSLLGGGNTVDTYSASGLFNSIVQAGTTAAGSTPAAGPESADQAIVDSLAQPQDAASTLGGLAATVPVGSFDATSAYAAILQASPGLASSVIADSTEQAIISSISSWA